MTSVLVIGYGNPLRGDDGVGWLVAGQLTDMPFGDEVQVLSCHQLTPDLAEPLSHVDAALFVDAAARTGEPGYAFKRVSPATLEPGGFSHHVDPGVLLTLAQALYGRAPVADALIVTGVSFGYGEGLSPSVSALVPALIVQVRAWCADPFTFRRDDCEYNGTKA